MIVGVRIKATGSRHRSVPFFLGHLVERLSQLKRVLHGIACFRHHFTLLEASSCPAVVFGPELGIELKVEFESVVMLHGVDRGSLRVRVIFAGKLFDNRAGPLLEAPSVVARIFVYINVIFDSGSDHELSEEVLLFLFRTN